MVPMFRPQPDAGAIIQPQPTPLGLFLRDFQPLAPPDPIDPFLVHMPAVSPKQGGDATIAVAAELFSESDDRFGQSLLACSTARLLALGRSVLTERLTGPAL